MCGIFGYVGEKEAVPLVMEGIKKLDYRGYDSAGLAAICAGKIDHVKKVGAVSKLQEEVAEKKWDARLAIAHTRWATHGRATHTNAHPHFDSANRCAVAHNGIIENHEALRKKLKEQGVVFQSQTDSEVIAQYVGHIYKGDFLKAVQEVVSELKGAFAFTMIHQDHPDEIVCVARECPLAIGLGEDEMYISSDSTAFLKYTNRVIFLGASEVALVRPKSVSVFDATQKLIEKRSEKLNFKCEDAERGPYQHYLQKEIEQQPQTVLYSLLSRYNEEFGIASLDELNISDEELLKIERILIVACGTSYHAGLVAAHMLEEKARIPVQVEISSEYRYKNPIVQANTLAIAISQSGETADTIAAMRELQEKGAKIVGLCNAQGSTIAREVASCLFLRAGPEISVASTKAFTSQLVLLSLLTLKLARMRTMSQKEGKDFIQDLLSIPSHIRQVLESAPQIAEIAARYYSYDNFFFLGRRYMYPTALEASLKLKEIAYVNANGYAAGEIKHGPIALIDEKTPTLAFCADALTYPKMINNLMEIKARWGKIIAIATKDCEEIESIADEIIWVPKIRDEFAAFSSTVVGQLFAYECAKKRGCEIDKPRNLAKSVTVE